MVNDLSKLFNIKTHLLENVHALGNLIDKLLHIIGLTCRQDNFSVSATNLVCIFHERYVRI